VPCLFGRKLQKEESKKQKAKSKARRNLNEAGGGIFTMEV
jgi:hypothetical protein